VGVNKNDIQKEMVEQVTEQYRAESQRELSRKPQNSGDFNSAARKA
jgi:hypothetical protein